MLCHISVIVSTYNKLEELKLCLRSLEKQTFESYEVIVVDDGSTDKTSDFMSDFLLKTEMKCKYCKQEKIGYRLARARNLGITFSTGIFLVFLDADMLSHPQLLRSYWKAYSKDPYGLYYGRILYVRTINVGKIDKSHVDNFDTRFLSSLSRDQDPREDALKKLPKYQKVWGGNMGVSRKLIARINGFDEDFKDWGGEDFDLALRLQRLGCKITKIPEALCFHLGDKFLPLSHVKKLGGVRLFNKKKKKDKNVLRNATPDEEKCLVTLTFDRSKFRTQL